MARRASIARVGIGCGCHLAGTCTFRRTRRRKRESVANSVRGGGPNAADIGLALYQALRTNGSSVPAKAAAAIGLTDAEAEAGWRELEELGLIRPGDSGDVVDPVEPDTALIELLARQR